MHDIFRRFRDVGIIPVIVMEHEEHAEKLADILVFVADKGHITTEVVVNHFGFTPTTAKRYLRQLTEFGYLEAQGGNRNRSYRKR